MEAAKLDPRLCKPVVLTSGPRPGVADAYCAAADPDMTANPGSVSKTTKTIFENQNPDISHTYSQASWTLPALGNSKRTDVLYYKMTYKTRFL
jgi:hypothetical protein